MLWYPVWERSINACYYYIILIIQSLFLQVEKYKSMVPYEDMTVEEYEELFPELEERKKKYPWWPHYAVWE